jgi:hypothetical protein
METIITYTISDINLLCQSLAAIYDSFIAKDFKDAISNPHGLSSERALYTKHLTADESWELRCREPYGETKVFVIFYNQGGHLEFDFCTRHLKNFLYKTDLIEMPLLLNTYFIGTLASWRLKIAK